MALTGFGTASSNQPASVAPALPADPSSPPCHYFSLSLAADHGGQPSPLAAAVWFANGHNGLTGWRIPASGWRVVPDSLTQVRSESMTLRVTRLGDGSWQVISGYRC